MRHELHDVGDAELLRRFLDGDRSSFEELMKRHEQRIFSLAYRMTGNRADALDATQETFVAAFRQAHTFRGSSGFGTWLYTVGMNACRDLMRKRTRLHVVEEDARPERAATGSGVGEQVAARIDVARALAALPEEYRESVVLHDLGGVPYNEIATLTKTSIGTVKSRISRGRRRLAEILEQQPETETSKDMA